MIPAMVNPAEEFKLTISTLVCPNWTLEQIIEWTAANGIGGIDFRGIGLELDITQLPAFGADLPATLKALQDHNLQMPCFNSSVVLVTPTLTKWQTMLEEARRYAALAKHNGTKFLRIFGGGIPTTMSREDARELAQEHLSELAKICNSHSLKPLLETHDSWVTSDAVFEIIGKFSAEQVGVLWDLEHPFRLGESPAATAAALRGRLDHVHIKDTIRRQGKSIPMLLGEGELPLQECLTELRKIGYSGWISLETEKRWHSEGPEPEVSVPQFARYMRS